MNGLLAWGIAAAAGLGLAAASYVGTRQPGAPWFGAAFLRWIAAAILVALLLDAPVARATMGIPLVALDASASWLRGGDSSWTAARAIARAGAGDSLLLFGDSTRAASDAPALPGDAASRLGPAVDRAVAAGRALHILTDGRLDDADALARLPRGSRVEVIAGEDVRDLAAQGLEAPRAAVAGDSIDVRVTLVAGASGSDAATLRVTFGAATAEAALDSFPAYAEREVAVRLPVTPGDGARTLRAAVTAPGDVVPANDTVATVVEVSPAAGAVLVSTSPDNDVRGLLAVLRGTTQLPTRAFLRITPDQWRVEGTLAPVSEAAVRAAVRAAPLVVVHGDTAVFGPPASATRGAVLLVVPPPETQRPEWYPTGAPTSPLAAALGGVAWDSLAPLTVRTDVPPGAWSGLDVRLNRTGARAAPIVGRDGPPRRAIVAAAGFWRWEFRGGAGADVFRALWGGILDWLAAERVDPRPAIPETGIQRAGDPIRWRRGSAADSVVAVSLTRRGAVVADERTAEIRFLPGQTVAETAPLPVGEWTARFAGGEALLVVNPARELLPRRRTVESGDVGAAPGVEQQRTARSVGWLYLVAVAALCIEWLLRRRAGLR